MFGDLYDRIAGHADQHIAIGRRPERAVGVEAKHVGGRPFGDAAVFIHQQDIIVALAARFPFGGHWRDVVRSDLGLGGDDVAAPVAALLFDPDAQHRFRGLLTTGLAGRDVSAGVVSGHRQAHAIVHRHNVNFNRADERAGLHDCRPGI